MWANFCPSGTGELGRCSLRYSPSTVQEFQSPGLAWCPAKLSDDQLGQNEFTRVRKAERAAWLERQIAN
eukprot:3250453-Lingulodinium_polyedra.AAC.1